MKGKSGRLALTVVVIVLACGLAACSSKKQPPAPSPLPEMPSAPPAPGEPRIITDLSALSSSNGSGKALALPEGAVKAVAGANPPTSVTGGLKAAGSIRYVGNGKRPGEERLLNIKAAQYNDFCARLMDQVFTAMLDGEREDPIDRLQLPRQLKPVILVATLNGTGQLKEILLEQHSGQAAVDKMVIDACKKALWARNPPLGARDKDGNYKVRLTAFLKNYASSNGETWTFKTYLGIALL
jgi:hypothetical protein